MTTATADTHGHDDHGAELSATGAPSDASASGPSYDDINTPVIVMVGVISIIVTVCTILFVQGMTYQWQNSYIRERSFDTVNAPVQAIVAEQKELLRGEAEGVRPIDEAMADVVEEYGRSNE